MSSIIHSTSYTQARMRKSLIIVLIAVAGVLVFFLAPVSSSSGTYQYVVPNYPICYLHSPCTLNETINWSAQITPAYRLFGCGVFWNNISGVAKLNPPQNSTLVGWHCGSFR